MMLVDCGQPQRTPDEPLSSLAQYMRDVRRYLRLSDEEERQLIGVATSSGTTGHETDSSSNILDQRNAARERLIAGYQPLVIALAKKLTARCRHLTLLDMIQEGNLGLIYAVDQYAASASRPNFRRWAIQWIRGAMLSAFYRHEHAIRFPPRVAQSLRRLENTRADLYKALERPPTEDELAAALGITVERVRDLLVLAEFRAVPLPTQCEAEMADDMTSDSPAQTLADTSAARSVGNSIVETVKRLPQREREVIELRYGFADGVSRTQQEVAFELGIGTSTVEGAETRALFRLRNSLAPLGAVYQPAVA